MRHSKLFRKRRMKRPHPKKGEKKDAPGTIAGTNYGWILERAGSQLTRISSEVMAAVYLSGAGGTPRRNLNDR